MSTLVRLPNGREIFVEVKAHGWEEEVVLLEGWQRPGLRLAKYIAASRSQTAPIPKAALGGFPRQPVRPRMP